MESISFHDDQGRIIGSTTASGDTMDLTKEHSPMPWVEGRHDTNEVYAKDGQAHPRPPQSTRLDYHTLSNLPVPCVIEINGAQYECEDTEAELVLDQDTTYEVVVRAWPHMDKEFTIENYP